MTTAINIADVRIECRESASASKRFIRHVRLTAVHPQHGTLGTLEAYKIERVYALKGHFLEYLDAKSAELSDFGEKVLDENLNVYLKLIDHEYHKGTGCWGAELNDGDIVYLHSVKVGVEHEHQGIGTRLVSELLSPAHVDKYTIVYSWPSASKARSRAECRVLNPPIINFFRKLGFRRVGRTTYFAYSPDSDHPSRSLAASEDLNIDPYKYAQRTTGAIQDEEAAALKQVYPLHTLLDPPFPMTDLVRGLHPGSEPRTPPPTKEDVAAAIEAAYMRDPASIHARDERGFTPLYIAATKGHGLALEKLFDLADCREDILCRDNVEDQNAIEAHLEAMRLSNKMMAVLGPAPLGFSDGGLSMNYVLRRKAGEDVGTLEDFMARQRYDCSCGQCRGGWLSARMAAALVAEVKMNFAVGTDMASDSFSRRRRDSFGLDSELDLPGVEFVPPLLRQRLNRTFYQGFLGVHRAIGSLIERGVLPTPDAVINEATDNRTDGYNPFDVQMYLASGGTAEFAINYLVCATKDQMMDGSLLEIVEESADWDVLPRCTNDWQFALVGRMMGLVATQQWGPYGGGGGGLFEDPAGTGQGCYYADGDSSDEGEAEEDVEMCGAGTMTSYGVDMAAAARLYDVEAILSSLRR